MAVNTRAISNVDLWNAVRAHNPQFASHTAEGTADLFTERGYGTITAQGMSTLNEFWQLAMPYYLNLVNISHARDRLEENGFGERFDVPWGGYVQRMSVDSIKPITPAYRDLVNGQSYDPFVVRKPKASERFWAMNYDYQSLVTMPDEWQTKRIFTSEYGMSEFLAGVFTGLENGYIIQSYLNKLEVLNAAINSTEHPLQDSQVVTLTMSDNPTETELVNFVLGIKLTLSAMTIGPQTGAYNAEKWESIQDESRLKLLVRVGYKSQVEMIAARNSYHADTLNLPIDVIEVPNFGGLEPYKEAAYTTPLYPVYDKLGERTGWNTKADGTGAAVNDDAVYWKDPNADVYAILADKGVVAEFLRNQYQVEPIRNPRGRYQNYWASAPDNAIVYDPLYNMVVIKVEPPVPDPGTDTEA